MPDPTTTMPDETTTTTPDDTTTTSVPDETTTTVPGETTTTTTDPDASTVTIPYEDTTTTIPPGVTGTTLPFEWAPTTTTMAPPGVLPDLQPPIAIDCGLSPRIAPSTDDQRFSLAIIGACRSVDLPVRTPSGYIDTGYVDHRGEAVFLWNGEESG